MFIISILFFLLLLLLLVVVVVVVVVTQSCPFKTDLKDPGGQWIFLYACPKSCDFLHKI